MAIDFLNPDDAEKEKDKQNADNASAQSSPATQSSVASQQSQSVYGGGSGSNSAPGSGPASNAGQRKGTGFTNLSRVIGANQGNRLGTAVGGGISQAVGGVRQQVGQAQSDFQNQANQNRMGGADQQARSADVINRANQGQALSDQDYADVQKYTAGQYQGPTSLANQDQLIAQAQSGQALGQMGGTAAGRQNLLQRYAGGKQYTGGERSLDSILLGQTAQPQLNQARRESAGLGQYAQGQADQASQLAKQYGGEAQQFGKDTVGNLTTSAQQEQTNLANQAAAEQARYGGEYSQLQNDLSSGNITQDEANKLGLSNGQYLYGSSLSAPNILGAYNPGVQKATAQNVASSQDYARASALAKLGGNNYDASTQQYLQSFTDPTKAGTFEQQHAYDLIGATPDQIKTMVQQAQTQAEGSDAYKKAQQDISDSTAALQNIDQYRNAYVPQKTDINAQGGKTFNLASGGIPQLQAMGVNTPEEAQGLIASMGGDAGAKSQPWYQEAQSLLGNKSTGSNAPLPPASQPMAGTDFAKRWAEITRAQMGGPYAGSYTFPNYTPENIQNAVNQSTSFEQQKQQASKDALARLMGQKINIR